MTESQRLRRAASQKQLVAECRAAMPPDLTHLWDTLLHAPSLAFEPLAEALLGAFPEEEARMTALLSWFGHGLGDCPICRMLVGSLVFTFPEPVKRVADAVETAASTALLSGACLFLGSQLRPRHALQAGVSRQRLEVLKLEVQGLPAPIKRRLVAHGTSGPGLLAVL